MILKRPWLGYKKNSFKAYSSMRKKELLITDEYMRTGQSYIDCFFEKNVAPLIVLNHVKFEVIPADGDYMNVSLDNMLLSGPGKHKGLSRIDAENGNILRLFYDNDVDEFSYIYKINGNNYEFRYKDFDKLRNRVAQSRYLHGLRNICFLLTIDEYIVLYNDYIIGLVNDGGRKFDILSYKKQKINVN